VPAYAEKQDTCSVAVKELVKANIYGNHNKVDMQVTAQYFI
jgi:hypothetical protein